MKKKNLILVVVTGLALGAAGVGLMLLGNPANMGFCIACFVRDTSGALHLHSAPVVQYARPEIIGLLLGSFIVSLVTKEFKARGGSSPLTRFVLGFFVMITALVFLGCPLRMVLRMAAGDLNAWVGLVGFVLGVYIGTLFLKNGYSLGRTYKKNAVEGAIMPATQVVLLVLLATGSSLLAWSESGPGAARAPMWIALVIALIIGGLAQRSRICQMGGFRDLIMLKDPHLFWGGLAIFVAALVFNLAASTFNLGFQNQPIAHSEHLWNLLAMVGVGLGSALLGGCPMRQLVLTGTGNVDSAITMLGFLVGAAFAHNFGLASGGEKIEEGVRVSGGTTEAGRIAVIVAIVIMLVIGFAYSKKKETAEA
ncbi:MAG: YedE family putative selenium transporter [Eubacteriales bacterium]|nr:YedE family putative selenium transporter [Eubacteriales bacterium]MDD4540663.1 YedE family putative selenium transporter [Eubacteriales bacterium]